jgi:hypothetical protein
MRTAHLKVIGIASGLAAAIFAAEWFATYCVFSNDCPAIVAGNANFGLLVLGGG